MEWEYNSLVGFIGRKDKTIFDAEVADRSELVSAEHLTQRVMSSLISTDVEYKHRTCLPYQFFM